MFRTFSPKKKIRIAACLTAVFMLLTAVSCNKAADNIRRKADVSPSNAIVDMNIDEMPESLTQFLHDFSDWYYTEEGEFQFDCQKNYSNIMQCIMTQPSCVKWSAYPVKQPKEYDYSDKHDPKKWAKETGYYLVYNEESVKWIITNIFNVSGDKIPEMSAKGEKDKVFYGQKGKYYRPMGAIGDRGLKYGLVSVKYDGKRYYVDYNSYVDGTTLDEPEWDGQLSGSFSAELELKTIDGKEYWSVYKAKQTAKAKND